MIRLNSYLAKAGVASRRKADDLIRAGRVMVNGQVVEQLGSKVGPGDQVEVDGSPVAGFEKPVVYLLHKPAGVISTVSDERGRKTVRQLIRDDRRLYPVGRLDRDTTGILLLTNIGDVALRLTHPRYKIEKEYLAEVRGRLSGADVTSLRQGLKLVDGLRVKAAIRKVGVRREKTLYSIVLTEGKNREIKRIFQHFSLQLLRLHRVRFAFLTADALAPGRYRRLSKTELDRLLDLVGGLSG